MRADRPAGSKAGMMERVEPGDNEGAGERLAHFGRHRPTRRDYDDNPGRYRAGMRLTAAHLDSGVSLHETIAGILRVHHVVRTVDIGCGNDALRRANAGGWLVGLDASATMLRDVLPPAVQADALALPFADDSFDAAVAVNVLDHLHDPVPALLEARRVVRPGGLFVAGAISRRDSPEFAPFWSPSPSCFDSEDAPDLVRMAFDRVEVRPWDARLLTLPNRQAVRDYLAVRFVPPRRAAAVAQAIATPLRVTKRGALILAT
jgi:SAM-dependent methyltransferase